MGLRFNRSAVLWLAAVLCALPAALRAQGGGGAGGDDFTFDDIPVDDVKQYYVAAGGGYLGMMTFMNVDELNKVAASVNVGKFSGQMTMHGGGGVVSLLFVPNLRFGVFGAAGSQALQAKDQSGGMRSLRFRTSITAFQADYAVRIFKSLTVLPGVMLGAENYGLEMTQTEAGGPQFDSLFSGNQGATRNANISNAHPFYLPAVNLEYALTQFFMIRAGVGYKGAFGVGDWTNDADVPVRGTPNINANGLSLQFGVFLGLFQNQ